MLIEAILMFWWTGARSAQFRYSDGRAVRMVGSRMFGKEGIIAQTSDLGLVRVRRSPQLVLAKRKSTVRR